MGPWVGAGVGDVCVSPDLLQAIPLPSSVSTEAISSRLVICDKCPRPSCARIAPQPMTNPARPWTRFYPPGTPEDLGPLPYPHMPAAIRDASATYARQQAFTLALPNGSQGSITYED